MSNGLTIEQLLQLYNQFKIETGTSTVQDARPHSFEAFMAWLAKKMAARL